MPSNNSSTHFSASPSSNKGKEGSAHGRRKAYSREHHNSCENLIDPFVTKIRMMPGRGSVKSGRLNKEQKQYCGMKFRDLHFTPSSGRVFLCDRDQKKLELSGFPALGHSSSTCPARFSLPITWPSS